MRFKKSLSLKVYFSFLFQSSGSTKIDFKNAKIGAKNLKYLCWMDSEPHT